jgi:hypothetical protein
MIKWQVFFILPYVIINMCDEQKFYQKASLDSTQIIFSPEIDLMQIKMKYMGHILL